LGAAVIRQRNPSALRLPCRFTVPETGPQADAYLIQKAAAEQREAEFDDYPPDFRKLVNAIGLKTDSAVALIYELYQRGVTDHRTVEKILADRAYRQAQEAEEAFG
jgi:hypothetical protein